MSEKPSLLKLYMDGELVAEAPLTVYDTEKAWACFQNGFAALSTMMVGTVYNAVRIACDPDLLAKNGPVVAMSVQDESKPKPTIYVPQSNGHTGGY